jgi:hypothetical protein
LGGVRLLVQRELDASAALEKVEEAKRLTMPVGVHGTSTMGAPPADVVGKRQLRQRRGRGDEVRSLRRNVRDLYTRSRGVDAAR